MKFFYETFTNKLMKRLSLYLFLILFTLQTPSQADDIRDFQIAGMSIGDSALDYFTKSEIKENIMDYYENRGYHPTIEYLKELNRNGDIALKQRADIQDLVVERYLEPSPRALQRRFLR